MAKLSPNPRVAFGPQTDSLLNVVVAFQGAPEQERAMRVCDKVTQVIGNNCVQSSWWEIDRLTDSTMLYSAVDAAVDADVVVVSLRAGEELPAGLRAWVDAWVLRREREVGALVALLGVPEGMNSQASRMQKYLQGIASSGHLDFMAQEQVLPAVSESTVIASATVIAQMKAEPVCEIYRQCDNSYSHGGINE